MKAGINIANDYQVGAKHDYKWLEAIVMYIDGQKKMGATTQVAKYFNANEASILWVGTVVSKNQTADDPTPLFRIVYEEDGDEEDMEYKEVLAFHKVFQAYHLGFLEKEMKVEDVTAAGIPVKLNISID
eukprot:CAMPEP_0194563722 /NCGR_PEP_ID=MMETSP0292-20121207/3664_1 /TAXON_ID=39354 /ORGANISM="Heterosigma akashiwo, Strain CCMP2393" /LENGTH=128 /DNA_ID=CAMNT_0039412709 /DNA_START=201 /DNA_END=587 /DNA_ORIENTATION=+